MRKLYINGYIADIDETTAIGIDINVYDVKDPGNTKVNVSNNFTLPATAQNLNILGFGNNIQTLSTNIYNAITCDYYIDNVQLIKKGKISISEISDRISCIITNSVSIWDTLKAVKYNDIQVDFFNYMCARYSYPVSTSQFYDSFTNLLNTYLLNQTEGWYLPYMAGNLYRAESDDLLGNKAYLETAYGMALNTKVYKLEGSVLTTDYSKGGHICVYIKDFFRYLEQKYSVNFYVDVPIAYNIWDDATANAIYIRQSDIILRHISGDGYYFTTTQVSNYAPYSIEKGFEGKTVFEVIKGFFQLLNIIPIEVSENNYRLSRFDELLNKQPIDLSGDINAVNRFAPAIENYAQQNYIKFKSTEERVNPLTGAKTIICENKNIEVKADVASIESHLPSNLPAQGGLTYLDMSTEKTISEVVYMIDSGVEANSLIVYFLDENETVAESVTLTNLPKASAYSPVNEYLLLEDMAEYPKVYEIEKWLKLSDIIDLDLFNLFYFKELGASFFINKIKGFNPQNSKEPTTLELIQASYKTPIPSYATEYIVDGVDEPFTDGDGNYFY